MSKSNSLFFAWEKVNDKSGQDSMLIAPAKIAMAVTLHVLF